jgi:hypothetical protein
MKGILVLVFCAILVSFPAAAEEGFRASTDMELQASSSPEVRLRLSESLIFPFLKGSSPLTSDNNLALTFTVDATPVSLAGIGEINWTPAAFLVLSGGGQAGSGWNIPIGTGVGRKEPENEPVPNPGDPPRKAVIVGDTFDGLIWHAWGAGTFQFDLGAVIPGDWTHIVFSTRHEFRYSGYTRAGPGDFWFFENDDGENMNGWKYMASDLLGYQMPLSPVLDTIAILAQLEKPLYKNVMDGDKWGVNLGRWTFSGIVRLSFSSRISSNVGVQIWTRKNFGTSDFEDSMVYYPDAELRSEGGQRRFLYSRGILTVNLKIW